MSGMVEKLGNIRSPDTKWSPINWTQGAVTFFRFVIICIALSMIWVSAYRFVSPPGTITMVAQSISGQNVVQQWTPWREISPNLVLAVIAAEDGQFCRHYGFDLGAIKEAVNEARQGKGLRGASTISQQTAKNAFLWNGGGFIRKGAEAWYTVWIEVQWPKRRIMEIYLNIAEWGDGLFGAQAAAQARFGKSAEQLTRRQAALLASVLPSPNKWRVDPPGPYVQRRAQTIRKRMDIIERNGWNNCAW